MDEKTLRTTVHQMYHSAQGTAEKNPEVYLSTRDFERVLGVAKGMFGDNEAIRNMEIEDEKILAPDLALKLSIVKSAIDEHFAKIASEKLRMRGKGRLLR